MRVSPKEIVEAINGIDTFPGLVSDCSGVITLPLEGVGPEDLVIAGISAGNRNALNMPRLMDITLFHLNAEYQPRLQFFLADGIMGAQNGTKNAIDEVDVPHSCYFTDFTPIKSTFLGKEQRDITGEYDDKLRSYVAAIIDDVTKPKGSVSISHSVDKRFFDQITALKKQLVKKLREYKDRLIKEPSVIAGYYPDATIIDADDVVDEKTGITKIENFIADFVECFFDKATVSFNGLFSDMDDMKDHLFTAIVSYLTDPEFQRAMDTTVLERIRSAYPYLTDDEFYTAIDDGIKAEAKPNHYPDELVDLEKRKRLLEAPYRYLLCEFAHLMKMNAVVYPEVGEKARYTGGHIAYTCLQSPMIREAMRLVCPRLKWHQVRLNYSNAAFRAAQALLGADIKDGRQVREIKTISSLAELIFFCRNLKARDNEEGSFQAISVGDNDGPEHVEKEVATILKLFRTLDGQATSMLKKIEQLAQLFDFIERPDIKATLVGDLALDHLAEATVREYRNKLQMAYVECLKTQPPKDAASRAKKKLSLQQFSLSDVHHLCHSIQTLFSEIKTTVDELKTRLVLIKVTKSDYQKLLRAVSIFRDKHRELIRGAGGRDSASPESAVVQATLAMMAVRGYKKPPPITATATGDPRVFGGGSKGLDSRSASAPALPGSPGSPPIEAMV